VAKPPKFDPKAHFAKPPAKSIESQVVFKGGAYNPAKEFHVKDPYYRFARKRTT